MSNLLLHEDYHITALIPFPFEWRHVSFICFCPLSSSALGWVLIFMKYNIYIYIELRWIPCSHQMQRMEYFNHSILVLLHTTVYCIQLPRWHMHLGCTDHFAPIGCVLLIVVSSLSELSCTANSWFWSFQVDFWACFRSPVRWKKRTPVGKLSDLTDLCSVTFVTHGWGLFFLNPCLQNTFDLHTLFINSTT